MGLGSVTVLMERTLQEAEKPTFLSPSCVFINSFGYLFIMTGFILRNGEKGAQDTVPTLWSKWLLLAECSQCAGT